MGNRGYSDRGFGGRINHYDEHGHKTGYSDPGLFGGYTNYDAKGNKTGHSDPAFFGGYNHYDNKGHKTGNSSPNGMGGFTHYDSHGQRSGSSNQTFPGHYDNNEGCYIATCVYGSYDCPEVWTLRRFRDDVLKKSVFGRAFVKTYYATSPTAVRLFGEKAMFRRFWKTHLDRFVVYLSKKGIDSSPYTKA